MTLRAIFDQARSLDIAHKSSESCNATPMAPGRFHSAGNVTEISAIETKKPEPVTKELPDDRENQGTSCLTAPVQHPKKEMRFLW